MALTQFISCFGGKIDYIMHKNKYQGFSNVEVLFIPRLLLKNRNENR